MNEVELCKSYWEVCQELDELKEQQEALNEKKKDLGQKIIDYLMEEGKSSTGHIAGVGNFIIAKELYPSVTKENMPKFFSYLRDKGEGDMIQEHIAPQTLKAYLKQRLAEDRTKLVEEPEQIEKLFPGKELTINEALLMKWQKHGVAFFEDTKLQHRDKGKS